MDEIWEARRVKLQDAAKVAALALLNHMNGAAQVEIPIDGHAFADTIVIGMTKKN